MATKGAVKSSEKELDVVSRQANLTAQIESERVAAKKWWEEYGTCYLDNTKVEDFTYEARIAAIKDKLNSEKLKKATLHTTHHDLGCAPPFKECIRKKV